MYMYIYISDLTPGPKCGLCTKQPLNKGHPYITANNLFPKGGRYRGVPLYNRHHQQYTYTSDKTPPWLAVSGCCLRTDKHSNSNEMQPQVDT